MKIILLFLILIPIFSSVEFDPSKAIELLNNLVKHPRQVIEKLEKYKVNDLIAALGFHAFSNYTISKQCHDELTFLGYGFIDGARRHGNGTMTDEERRKYLIPMMDSAGKIGSGISRGHILSTGQFKQCKNVKIFSTTLNKTIRGDYYRILFDIKMRPNSYNNSCGIPQIGVDLCLPSACKDEDLTDYFRFALGSNSSLSPVCNVRNVNQRIPKKTIVSYIVLGFLCAMVTMSAIAGIIDYYFENRTTPIEYERIKKKSGFGWKMFMAFSLYRNVKEVFTMKGTKKEGQISSLNFIRTISTVWVILGHCSALMILVCTNPLDMLDYMKTVVGLSMANAYFAVDTFFFISAFLLSFLWFKGLNRNRRATLSAGGWMMFYVHRIARLTPVYYITIFTYTFVYTRFVRDMPMLMSPTVNDDYCQHNFWLNLLYVDNLVNPKEICYVISWYLATDLQIYIFTPFLLIPFAIWGQMIGILCCSAVFIASTAFNAFQMFAWYFPPSQYQFGPQHPKYNPEIRRYDLWNYYNPLIRCQIYVMGMILGYFMNKIPKMKINAWVDRVMWTISLGSMIFVMMILRGYTSGTLWTPLQNAMYSCFSRVIWGLALSWIIISTKYRKGLINDFMSLPFWAPLSRLSFCAYLVHIMVCGLFFGRNLSDLYFSSLPDFFLDTVIPVTTISFIVAIFWTCIFEIPLAKILNMTLGGAKNPSTNPKIEVNKISTDHNNEIEVVNGVLKIPINFQSGQENDIRF